MKDKRKDVRRSQRHAGPSWGRDDISGPHCEGLESRALFSGGAGLEAVAAFQSVAFAAHAPVNSAVGYDANPDKGFAFHDSVPFQGIAGWQVADGTIAGTSQWTASISSAGQEWVLAGNSPLNGAGATLALPYTAYCRSGTSLYTSYDSTIHNDVTSSCFSPAASGYDHVIGLGVPWAFQVIVALGNDPIARGPAVFGGAVALGSHYSLDLERPNVVTGSDSAAGSSPSDSGPDGSAPSGSSTATSGSLTGAGTQMVVSTSSTSRTPAPTTPAGAGFISPGIERPSNVGVAPGPSASGHATGGAALVLRQRRHHPLPSAEAFCTVPAFRPLRPR